MRLASAEHRPRLDATRLLPGLAQGSVPPSAAAVLDAGYTGIVFCAQEIQPPEHVLTGLRVLRCPLTDDSTRPVAPEEWKRAITTATAVALAVRTGERVLVTCAQGRNRSGLVCAVALHFLTGCTGSEAIEYIRRRRKDALTNPAFTAAIRKRLG